jgi:hypothetical protein
MSQTIRIPPRSAPALVQRFGEVGTNTIYGSNATASIAPVQRFVEKVLGATVEGYFHTTASQHTVEEFFEKSELVRKELEDSVRNALADWDVKAVRTALGEFIAPDGRINEIRQAPAEERELEKAAEIAMIRELLAVLGRDYLAQERFIERKHVHVNFLSGAVSPFLTRSDLFQGTRGHCGPASLRPRSPDQSG